MADQVQYVLDRMAPVLVELQRLGIFALDEVKQIVAARKQHEYKLKRRQLTVSDFLEYLEYEMNLEQLRRARMKRLRIMNAGKAEGHGIRHVSYIFERAVRRFPNDIALWEAYLNFLQKYNSKSIFSSVLMRALHLHPRNAQLWIRAASMETVLNGNSHAARVMMQRAIRINPHDKELWLFYFRQEMFEAVKVQKRREALGLSTVKRKGDGSVEAVESADGDNGEEVSNAGLRRLMNGDIAAIVFNHAMDSSAIKPEEQLPFALQMYQQAFQYRNELPAVRETVESRVREAFQGEAALYLTLAEIQLFSGDHSAETTSASGKSKRRRLDDPAAAPLEGLGEFGNALELLNAGLERIGTMDFRAKAAQMLVRFARESTSSNISSEHRVRCKELLTRLVEPLLSASEDSLATDASFQAAVHLAGAYYETQLLLPEDRGVSQMQQLVEVSEWLFDWLQTAFTAVAASQHQANTYFALTSLASTTLQRLEKFSAFLSTTEQRDATDGDGVQARIREMKDAIAQQILGVWRSICLVQDAHEQIMHALDYLAPADCLCTMREIVAHVSTASVNPGFVTFWCKQLARRAYQFEGVDQMLDVHKFLMKNTFATATTSASGGSKFLSYFLFVIDVVNDHATVGNAAQRSKWYEVARQLHEQALRAMEKTNRKGLYDSYVKLELANDRPERANQIRWRAGKDV